MTIRNPPSWVGGNLSHSVQNDRLTEAALWTPGQGNSQTAVRQGIIPGPALSGGVVTVTSPTTATVSAFKGIVQGSSARQGCYIVLHDDAGNETITYTAASTTQHRRDLVIAEVVDGDFGGGAGNYFWRLRVVQGVLAATAGAAARPTLPSNSIPLAELYVAPNSTAVYADLREFTVPVGGTVPMRGLAEAEAYYNAANLPVSFQRAVDFTNGRQMYYHPSHNKWVKSAGPPEGLYNNNNMGASPQIGASGAPYQVFNGSAVLPISADTVYWNYQMTITAVSGGSSIGIVEFIWNGLSIQQCVYNVGDRGHTIVIAGLMPLTLAGTISFSVNVYNNAGSNVFVNTSSGRAIF